MGMRVGRTGMVQPPIEEQANHFVKQVVLLLQMGHNAGVNEGQKLQQPGSEAL